jgi:hypothetical protein
MKTSQSEFNVDSANSDGKMTTSKSTLGGAIIEDEKN